MADLPPKNIAGRPQRIAKPSAAVLNDPKQTALPFQRRAAEDFAAAERERRAAAVAQSVADARQAPNPMTAIPGTSDPELPAPTLLTSKRASVEDVEEEDDDDDDDVREDARTNPKPKCVYFLLMK